MKKSFLKIGFMVALAMITTISLSSCSSDADEEGDGVEQSDADGDDEGDHNCEDGKCEGKDCDHDKDGDKCEDGKCEDGKCEDGKCAEGKCEAGDGKQAGKGATNTTEVTSTVPEEKPLKKQTRGGDAPKVTTDGNN